MYKFRCRTWLLCWQCNTHSLCNSHSHERRNKCDLWAALLQPACKGHVVVPLLHTVHHNTPSTHFRGSNSHGDLHIRPENAPGCADTVVLKPLHGPQLYTVPHDRDGSWGLSVHLKYFAVFILLWHQCQILNCLKVGAGWEPSMASHELLNG